MKGVPSWMKAAWLAFPPAPEDGRLRRLRIASMVLCLPAALSIGFVDSIVALHRLLIVPVGLVAMAAMAVTARYWLLKQRSDSAFQSGLGDAGVGREKAGEG
ncbi:hypothetical protein [Sphingomonas oryzagri]